MRLYIDVHDFGLQQPHIVNTLKVKSNTCISKFFVKNNLLFSVYLSVFINCINNMQQYNSLAKIQSVN